MTVIYDSYDSGVIPQSWGPAD